MTKPRMRCGAIYLQPYSDESDQQPCSCSGNALLRCGRLGCSPMSPVSFLRALPAMSLPALCSAMCLPTHSYRALQEAQTHQGFRVSALYSTHTNPGLSRHARSIYKHPHRSARVPISSLNVLRLRVKHWLLLPLQRPWRVSERKVDALSVKAEDTGGRLQLLLSVPPGGTIIHSRYELNTQVHTGSTVHH